MRRPQDECDKRGGEHQGEDRSLVRQKAGAPRLDEQEQDRQAADGGVVVQHGGQQQRKARGQHRALHDRVGQARAVERVEREGGKRRLHGQGRRVRRAQQQHRRGRGQLQRVGDALMGEHPGGVRHRDGGVEIPGGQAENAGRKRH